MAKIKKGEKLACVPCGREVTVDFCGISESTIWCCGKPMQHKAKLAHHSKVKPAKKKAKKR
ncbi:MAG: hypothetical protein PHQ96_05475 [Candidatus Omnitrophica bacterium]|nr:hypothetical protein [Candidatus Omnitrophota bacterium]